MKDKKVSDKSYTCYSSKIKKIGYANSKLHRTLIKRKFNFSFRVYISFYYIISVSFYRLNY